jgi:predicted DNA-binding transcriptional regulator AlpA
MFRRLRMERKIQQYVTEKEVSRITGLALPTLRNYRHLNKGPTYFKIGRSVRYSIDDIFDFMEQRRIETQPY